jgi:hypothetical protein
MRVCEPARLERFCALCTFSTGTVIDGSGAKSREFRVIPMMRYHQASTRNSPTGSSRLQMSFTVSLDALREGG